MNEKLWEKIVIIHNTNKSLFIWCEENDCQLKSFLQPNNELKNAWEHAIRAKGNELGLTGKPDNKYIENNLESVLSHEYRAFFDICDWLSINLRQRLIQTLQPYDNETINAVIPNYYIEIRPKADKFCDDIAKLRSSKDIAIDDEIIAHVGGYTTIINTLIEEEVTNLSSKVAGLEEHKCKKETGERKGYWKEAILVIIGAVLFAVGEWVVRMGGCKTVWKTIVSAHTAPGIIRCREIHNLNLQRQLFFTISDN